MRGMEKLKMIVFSKVMERVFYDGEGMLERGYECVS